MAWWKLAAPWSMLTKDVQPSAPRAWWKFFAPDPPPKRSAEDERLYDGCLMRGNGTVACDAFMRELERDRAGSRAITQVIRNMLASGYSRCTILEFAHLNHYKDAELSCVLSLPENVLREIRC